MKKQSIRIASATAINDTTINPIKKNDNSQFLFSFNSLVDCKITEKTFDNNRNLKDFYKSLLKISSLNGNMDILKNHNGLGFEKMKGEYIDTCSIRINQQYRMHFDLDKTVFNILKVFDHH